jgi:hypothetical protein
MAGRILCLRGEEMPEKGITYRKTEEYKYKERRRKK